MWVCARMCLYVYVYVCVWTYKCVSVYTENGERWCVFCVCRSSYGFFIRSSTSSSYSSYVYTLRTRERDREGEEEGEWVLSWRFFPFEMCACILCVCVCFFFFFNCRVFYWEKEREKREKETNNGGIFSHTALYYYDIFNVHFIVIRFRHYLIWYSDLIPMNTIRCIQFQLDTYHSLTMISIFFMDIFFSKRFVDSTVFNLSFNLKICFSFETKKKCFKIAKIDSRSTCLAYIYKKKYDFMAKKGRKIMYLKH